MYRKRVLQLLRPIFNGLGLKASVSFRGHCLKLEARGWDAVSGDSLKMRLPLANDCSESA